MQRPRVRTGNGIQTQDQKEQAGRQLLRRFGLHVESVAWIRRQEDEFAAVVCANERENQYDRALEVLTDPRCPLVVVREYRGRYDTRIYVQFAKS